MPFQGGPYVQLACFCEMVIEDKTGVLSLIRIVDVLTHAESGPNPPQIMPPFPYRLKLVLALKSGRAQGRHELRVVPELPSGETREAMLITLHLEGEEKGQNAIIDVAMVYELEGLYWFKVYLGDELLTEVPLRVKYSRSGTGI